MLDLRFTLLALVGLRGFYSVFYFWAAANLIVSLRFEV